MSLIRLVFVHAEFVTVDANMITVDFSNMNVEPMLVPKCAMSSNEPLMFVYPDVVCLMLCFAVICNGVLGFAMSDVRSRTFRL